MCGIRELSSPIRLQLSRRKGFDLQAHSLAANGLPAVNVARPTRWGNPARIGELGCTTAESAVNAYRRWLTKGPASLLSFREPPRITDVAQLLRGKNLACWCTPGAPCHADVLLQLANRPICEAVEGSGRNLADATPKSHPAGEKEGLS
jgi:hypothetical protein